jgi:hypothetical protein
MGCYHNKDCWAIIQDILGVRSESGRMVLRRKVVQRGTNNQSGMRQGGKLNNVYNYSKKGKEYHYRYRMIQIPE